MKTCFKCGWEKPYSEFYKHPQMGDGHLGKCKSCTQRDTRENYIARHGYYREKARERGRRPEQLDMRHEARRKHRARYPERARARAAVSRAIRNGTLERQPCGVCGTTSNIQAHHPDYSNPLGVEWYCMYHHREIEGRILVPRAA